MNQHPTRQAEPCLSCGSTGGTLHYAAPWVPSRQRGLCKGCYARAWQHGTHRDYPACGPRPVPNLNAHADHPAPLPAVITPAMLGIVPGQPPTDPALTPATVWAIAHRNAARAICWLVSERLMGPDEAAALAYLTDAPPAERAAAA